MQTSPDNNRGLSLILDLNWDLALFVATLGLALTVGAYIGTTFG